MGRVCAVKNCNRESAADLKRTKELNLKKPTFFKVSKIPRKRKEWMDSLATYLTERQYVYIIPHLTYTTFKINNSYITEYVLLLFTEVIQICK